MTPSDAAALRAQLIRHEREVLHLYRDSVGKWTIGVGRNLSDRGISHAEAQFLLDNDIAPVLAELSARFQWFNALDGVRQAVLANMGFNLGVPGLATFTTFLGFVEAGQYDDASDDMLRTLWAHQVGQRAVELSHQLRTGIWV